jgi:PAS domain S-box-containing protein
MTTATRIAPWLLALVVLGAGLAFLAQDRRAEAERLRAETEVTADQVAARLNAWLEDRLAVLERLAEARGRSADQSDLAFRLDARVLTEEVFGFQALNWVDAEGVIRIVVPEEPNLQALGRNLFENPDPSVRAAIDRATATLLPTRTHHVRLYQGGEAISVYWPVDAPGATYGGIVNGVLRIDQFVRGALPERSLRERYAIALLDEDGARVHGSDGDGTGGLAPALVVRRPIAFVDKPMTLELRPRRWVVAASPLEREIPWLIAILAVAVGLGLLLRGYMRRSETVEAREQRIRLLMDSTGEGLLGLDPDGRCTFCNAAALRLLGARDGDALVGEDLVQWLPECGDRSAPGPLAALQADEPVVVRGAGMRRLDGTRFDAEYRAHAVRRADGVSTGVVLTFRDISEELEGEEHNARLMAILEGLPDLVLLADARLEVVYLNPAGRTLLELRADGVATTLGGLLRDERRFGPDGEIPAALEATGLWVGETVLQKPDGASLPLSLVAMRHRDRHGGRYYSLVARDLTHVRAAERERTALEARFREAQKLESLGMLAGGIAHDFNNLLVGILGNASLALETIGPESAAHALLSDVQVAAERAAELTGQLLAYSGRGRFESRALDLGTLVSEMASLLAVTVPKRIRVEVDCEPGAVVTADAAQLRQLVMNLVTNAAEAVQGPGHVRVTVMETACDPAELDGRSFGGDGASGAWVALEVADDGVGMEQEVLDRIFEPFFTTKEEGKGLGLAAALGIVRGHRAVLNVTSRPGEGTRFLVLFPPSPETVAAVEERTAGTDRDGLRGRVLLVDDEPAVRGFVERSLEACGLSVVAAEDGLAGVEAFRQHEGRFDLVLLDQSMPGLSGDEARERMRTIRADVPAVLMSGYDRTEIRGDLAARGIVGFLQKPFRFDELEALLRRVLTAGTGRRGNEIVNGRG